MSVCSAQQLNDISDRFFMKIAETEGVQGKTGWARTVSNHHVSAAGF
ncbi:hypothetical protein [Ruegeria arenilitoris]|nr:hypothetical protein [Ruegeria arenilitoris]